jgi:hypothetical protein
LILQRAAVCILCDAVMFIGVNTKCRLADVKFTPCWKQVEKDIGFTTSELMLQKETAADGVYFLLDYFFT